MYRHIRKVFSTTSDRVKAVEFHPSEPMLAAALYNGTVVVYNTNDMSTLRTIRVDAQKPIRCVRWMPSINALIAAGDNLAISCYDYNTGSLIASKPDAHTDFVRQIAVHPTQAQFLSCSDDGRIHLYTIAKNSITVSKTYEGHEHFVMDVKFNPIDEGGTFASASLDCTIKFWGLTAQTARFSLKGHQAGVNCIEFFPGRDKPHLASGSDDLSIKIWDYQTKSCVMTLVEHRMNVTALKFHPVFPVLLSTAEDEALDVWNAQTFKHESRLNHQKKRGWCIDATLNHAAVGYDEGLVVLRIGRDAVTVITMDTTGRAYWARNNEVQSASLAPLKEKPDGLVDVTGKEVATSEFYPSAIAVNSNGKFVALWGDNEYSISSALAWRARGFGEGRELAWGAGDTYAVRVSGSAIQVFRGFTSTNDFAPPHECERIFGGLLLGLAGSDLISFFSWADLSIVRQIDVRARAVWWSPTSPVVAIATAENLYILTFNEDFARAADFDPAVGSAEAFSMIADREVKVTSGAWHGDVFFFTDGRSVFFFAGGHFEVAARPDLSLSIVGYVHRAEAIVLCDNDYRFYKYRVPEDVLAFVTTAAAGGDPDPAAIPPEWRSRMCAFLEELGAFEGALRLAENDDKRFDLALKMGDVDRAAEIARKSGSIQQWRHLAGVAMKAGRIDLLDGALVNAGDESAAVLLKSCRGQSEEMAQFAAQTQEDSKNVSFTAYFAARNFEKCIDLLIETGRAPEAALMARAYAPKRMDECARRWRELLIGKGEGRIADAIALPSEFPGLFGIVPENDQEPPTTAVEDEKPEPAIVPAEEDVSAPAGVRPEDAEPAPAPAAAQAPAELGLEEEEEVTVPPAAAAEADDDISALLDELGDDEFADLG
jgi:coatomer subunit beta'